MFEMLEARVRRVAEQRARERAAVLADDLRAELPPGIAAEPMAEGVRLSGCGIGRRFAVEPALRWLIAGLR